MIAFIVGSVFKNRLVDSFRGPISQTVHRPSTSTMPESTTSENSPVVLTHDFGHVLQGAEVKHIFTVQNSSGQDWKITGLDKSCGCTIVDKIQSSIPSEGSIVVPVTLRTKGKRGNTSQRVVLQMADRVPPVALIVVANVLPAVVPYPQLHVVSITNHPPLLGHIRVENYGDAPWKSLTVKVVGGPEAIRVTGTTERITVSLDKMPRETWECHLHSTYITEFEGVADARLEWTAVDDNGQEQSATSQLRFNCQPDVSILPQSLYLDFQNAKSLDRTLLIRYRDTELIPNPSEISVSCEGLSASISKISPAIDSVQSIAIRFAKPVRSLSHDDLAIQLRFGTPLNQAVSVSAKVLEPASPVEGNQP